MDVEICFANDLHVGKEPVPVAEKVEGEYYGAVGGVFEGNDTIGGAAGLNGAENVWWV